MVANPAPIFPAQKMKWDLRQYRAGQSSKVHLSKGLAMADKKVDKTPDVEPLPVDPADIEEPVVITGAKTIDSHEVSVGWTAQQGDVPSEPEPIVGTVVTVAELPSKESLVAAGVDLDQFFIGLNPAIVADDEERDVVRGVK